MLNGWLKLACAVLLMSWRPHLCFSADTTATITPGDNLVIEGVLPIPAKLAEDVERYTEFRSAAFADWHPSKREMLILTRFSNTSQIHHVRMPGGARKQLTFFPDRVGGGLFNPAGNSFLFVKDAGGNEFFQFYRFDFSSGDISLVTDGKSRNTGPCWSHSGERLAYGSTRRTGTDVDIYVVDPRDSKSDRLPAKMQGGGWDVLDWSPDMTYLLVLEEISANETYLWLIHSGTGQKTLLTPKGTAKIAYLGGAFSRDGKGLYVTTDKDSEFQRLAYIDLATKNHEYLTSDISWDIDTFDLSDNGKTIAFVANEDGVGKLHLLDTASRGRIPAPSLPVGSVQRVKWHKNNRDLAFQLDSARGPSDVYSLDMETGKIDRWTESETGGLVTDGFPEPELVHWKSFDGMSISGFLYNPPSKFTGKRPVVINIHGGPEGQFTPGFLGQLNYFLNEMGVAYLFPNVRGSSGYGKTFLTLDNGFLRENSYKDINALLDWIQTRNDLDSNRIMVTGGSYGGFMTLAIATNYDARIRCSLDIVGPSNLVTFLENTSGYRQDLRRVEYGDERNPKMREFLNRIAPANNAEKIHKPIFIVQGKNDPRVPASESKQMADVVRRNGTPVWYLVANDEGHGFAKKKNRDFLFYATVMFMKEYLLK